MTPSTDVWTSLASTPAGVNYGGALVYDGTDYIYCLGGNNTTNFWRYQISTGPWDTNALTAPPQNVQTKAAMIFGSNTDFIYVFVASWGTTFRTYQISTDTWSTVSPLLSNIGYGASLAYGGAGD